jgi:WD40 repeat protein
MMKLSGRYREHLIRMSRSYWLVIFATLAVGAITWRLCPPRPRLTFQNSEGWYPLALSPDGSILAAYTAAQAEDNAALWDALSGVEIERMTFSKEATNTTKFSPEGDLLFVDQGQVKVRTVPFGVEKVTEIQDVNYGSQMVFSADGRRAAVRCADRLEVWDWPKQQLIAKFSGQEFQNDGYSLSPDGATLKVGTRTWFQLWDVATASKDPLSQPIAELSLPSIGPFGEHELAPNNKVLVILGDNALNPSSSGTHTTGLRRISGTPDDGLSLIPYGELTPAEYPAYTIISSDSKMLALIRSPDRSPGNFWNRVNGFLPWLDIDRAGLETVLVDLERGEHVAILPGSGSGSFSSDSRCYAGNSAGGKIHLWDIPPRKPMGIVFGVAAVTGIMTWLVRRWFLRTSRL